MSDLRELVEEARAWLAWEQELGGIGLPPRVPRAAPKGPRREVGTGEALGADREAPAYVPPAHPSVVVTRPRVELPPRAPLDEARRALDVLRDEAAACTTCRLGAGRTHSVFSRGRPDADLVFVGEGPGEVEDREGLPFVGPAGQLLDKMIVAMGTTPDQVYICNVVKCRPPENRTPQPDEMAACVPFLEGQLRWVRPRVIVALGRTAAEGLGVMPPSGRGWRGTWTTYQGIDVMPTYHPAYLLRSPEQKRVVWEDLKLVMAKLGTPRGTP